MAEQRQRMSVGETQRKNVRPPYVIDTDLRPVLLLLSSLCSSLGRITLGDIMGTKRPKPAPPQQLEDLLGAHALRRLEGRPSSAPKRAKTKQNSKQKER
jgi:hypothetical protein